MDCLEEFRLLIAVSFWVVIVCWTRMSFWNWNLVTVENLGCGIIHQAVARQAEAVVVHHQIAVFQMSLEVMHEKHLGLVHQAGKLDLLTFYQQKEPVFFDCLLFMDLSSPPCCPHSKVNFSFKALLHFCNPQDSLTANHFNNPRGIFHSLLDKNPLIGFWWFSKRIVFWCEVDRKRSLLCFLRFVQKTFLLRMKKSS